MNQKSRSSTTVYRAPALDKGLDILEALSTATIPLSLTELSRILNRSTSELFRMVTLLEKRGYIIKEEGSGHFLLSLKLYELAHMHSPVERLLKASTQPMRKLARDIRQSCHVSVLRNGEVVVLSQEESPDKVRLSVEVGARFSPILTASGRVILSHLEEEEFEAFMRDNESCASLSESDREHLLERIEGIRNRGYEIAEHESHVGVRDIAIIVGNPRVGVGAALAVSSLTATKNPSGARSILDAMIDCAQQITQNVGLTWEWGRDDQFQDEDY